MKSVISAALGALTFLMFTLTYAYGPGSFPSNVCADERADSYRSGAQAQLEACRANPAGCNITLASCTPAPQYGESEPNDNLITADPLVLERTFSGQSYGKDDQDWFYVTTTAINQNLTVNFAVPAWIEGASLAAGTPASWVVTVRDSAGNVYARFDTRASGVLPSTPNAATYRVMLGLAGTYYIAIAPNQTTTSNASYQLTAFVQDTGLKDPSTVAGFYDSEIEPNDLPSTATPLATGVAMYGLVNLRFSDPLPNPDPKTKKDIPFVWGQGESDWYVYKSNGNEIVTLSFCAKEKCGSGNWYVEVYDQSSAQVLESKLIAQEPTNKIKPLLAINTVSESENAPYTYRLGFRDPGYYFMRVNHKRKFSAPCYGTQFLKIDGTYGAACSCDVGDALDVVGYSCLLPTGLCANESLGLSCTNVPLSCELGKDPGCFVADGKNNRPRYPENCPVMKKEDGKDTEEVETPCETYKLAARCECSSFGSVVEYPEGEYTSQYNFTWFGTQLPPNTIDTKAYDDFLNRPNTNR